MTYQHDRPKLGRRHPAKTTAAKIEMLWQSYNLS